MNDEHIKEIWAMYHSTGSLRKTADENIQKYDVPWVW